MILEVSNKHHGRVNKIPQNFSLDHNSSFSFVFEYYATKGFVPIFISQRRRFRCRLLFTLHNTNTRCHQGWEENR